eukprot:NODE_6061_length_532_cov_147.144654.p2 GENE.NODE_6061_length_532_cov_147.144654~~NODE_6061_length_532_cov_147.144654.p2  ORF type:complete len:128 (+),score=35.55 NODE_6061_length_532_cov_147.144654:3-386(+)
MGAGFKLSHNTGLARKLADAIGEAHASHYETWFCFLGGRDYQSFVEALKDELPPDQKEAFSTRKGWSSPFVWLEKPDGARHALGGCDRFREWAAAEFTDPAVQDLASRTPSLISDMWFNREPGTAVD